ncbi:hypothetical protein BO70DRAFT_79826 [Aspergillus heteromorphus CBS 117.55]|uniref:Uncharacterized protein n=1 Tax=Aspergillus heteromorphus CBS 117.55 TaxID=1448321 RepID=A0A317WY46_9EURO|nr:uncharacterized protein BO70DRAFT_79826 [Aspergillus heteromorphus CBS 117.55]PWY90841.1 hypothetical protein BO70DRAFT_79826 [Aspergillus heteromorphus CBS 117.55]
MSSESYNARYSGRCPAEDRSELRRVADADQPRTSATPPVDSEIGTYQRIRWTDYSLSELEVTGSIKGRSQLRGDAQPDIGGGLRDQHGAGRIRGYPACSPPTKNRGGGANGLLPGRARYRGQRRTKAQEVEVERETKEGQEGKKETVEVGGAASPQASVEQARGRWMVG